MTARSVSPFGEFVDKRTEKEFCLREISGESINYAGLVVFILAILFLLFAVSDYYLLGIQRKFYFFLGLRLLLFFLAVVFYYILKRIKDCDALIKWITAYAIICPAIYLFLIYHYDNPLFFIRYFAIILIVHGIFMLPNRWLNNLIAACLLLLSFFLLMYFRFPSVSTYDLVVAGLYSLVFIIFLAISSYWLQYYKRMQFLRNKELETLATRDTLTGIYNRLKFNEELAKWLYYARRYRTPLSLIMFDLDDFKRVNDTFGHLAGDKVISTVATLIQGEIRDTDVFARWGGEEFVILMPNAATSEARKLAQRLQNDIKELVFPEVGGITCSFGVVTLKEGDTADTLLSRADRFLYLAKQKGKNAVVCEDSTAGKEANL